MAGSLKIKWISFCLISELLGVQVFSQHVGMSSQSFDDQYEGCTKEMDNLVLGTLLEEELSNDENFRIVWNNATLRWKHERLRVPRGFRDEYGIAVMMYTNMMSPVYSAFNRAVREFNPSNFRYFSLHYLLTRAVNLLKLNCPSQPVTLRRGMKGVHLSPGDTENMRLGQFTSTTTDPEVAKSFGTDTVFTVTSHFGVNIRRFSYFPEQKEVLVPVDEVFHIKNFTIHGHSHRFIIETTEARCHYYNCYYLRGTKSSNCEKSADTKVVKASLANLLNCLDSPTQIISAKLLKKLKQIYRHV
ncbi:ecto-ADP-ribosyltransferase 5-like isoform X2 [Bombina bombina]|uniref:ecto-ADP-ribosyltransferase 5-like isoform X2 n=1 Tax=Bombina bombina TaxID=8345 RepID=UPI00235AE157|nr:ecto-ADP-ribosyltransferase 5-like isoform X2 [Bombina bombina]